MSLTDIDRQQIVAEARTWLGTPWHHAGRLKGVGVDCAMFLREVFIACGLVPPFAVEGYPEQWALHRSEERFLATLLRFGRRTTDRLPGNVIIFKFGRAYSHGGIIVDWPLIIHAHRPAGKVVYDEVSCSGLARRPQQYFEVSAWVGKAPLYQWP